MNNRVNNSYWDEERLLCKKLDGKFYWRNTCSSIGIRVVHIGFINMRLKTKTILQKDEMSKGNFDDNLRCAVMMSYSTISFHIHLVNKNKNNKNVFLFMYTSLQFNN